MVRLLSILFLGVFLAGAVQAQDERAVIRNMMQDRDREIKALLGDRNTFTDEQRERLKAVINDNIDFGEMGRTAVGAHWDNLTAAEQKKFIDTFSEVVRLQSLSNLDTYRATVTYDDVQVSGNKATVSTTATRNNVTTKVNYDLMKKQGQWLVVDISLDNVSTAEGYARSFQSMIRRRGFDALMENLTRRLERDRAEVVRGS